MSWQRRSRATLAVLIALTLTLALAAPAFAGISDVPSPLGESSTNMTDIWWRVDPVTGWGWGNSVYPDFTLNLPPGTSASDPDNPVLGILYTVDKNPVTEIDETQPYLYDLSPRPTGTIQNLTLDLRGIYAFPPPGGWAAAPAGARYGYEGLWYYHWSFYDRQEIATRTISAGFLVDVTPPAPVRKITAKPRVGYAGPSGVWFPTSRAVVTWEDMEYDALSGTARYHIFVNGSEIGGYDNDNVYHLGHLPRTFTIEDLPSGKAEIGIVVEDRATNLSTTQTVTFMTDPDDPTVNITYPATDGQLVPKVPTFKADAFDAAGIQWVDFAIDGKSVYTDKEAPYQFSKDMGAYSYGNHTLTAKVKDMYGRVVETSRPFKLDNTIPKISSISNSPNPFYPILTDGYKDTTTVNFYTSEGGSVVLYVYDSTGALFDKRSKRSIGSGWQSIVWDGLGAGPDAYSYKVSVKDSAGNIGYSGTGVATIRDYEIIRISPDAVQIIPR